MNIYHVTVLCQDDDGSRLVLDSGYFEAKNELLANRAARDEYWDERLTGNYLCVFQTEQLESPCLYCKEAEAYGECGDCGQTICEDCLGQCHEQSSQ